VTNSSAGEEAAKPAPRPARGFFRFPRQARLTRGREIRQVLRGGKRSRGPYVDVFWAPSPAGRPRLSVVVPRYGHSAASRNRVRRRVREAVRIAWLPSLIDRGLAVDMVLRARRGAFGAPRAKLWHSLQEPPRQLESPANASARS